MSEDSAFIIISKVKLQALEAKLAKAVEALMKIQKILKGDSDD